MEAVQWIMSVGTSFFEAIQLSNDLSHLRSILPKAHILIDRAERGRFKDKKLAHLLSELKDRTCDAEDILREFDDQVQRQKMENTGRSRTGQLVSSSFNLFKVWISGTKARLKEAHRNLDMAYAKIDISLDNLGLNVEPAELDKPLMPEKTSVIGVPQVYGRDEERDQAIERLGVNVMIGRDNVRDQVIKQLGVPLIRDCRSAWAVGKKVAAPGTSVLACTPTTAKRLKGESSRSVSAKVINDCIHPVPVLPIIGIGGVGKTTLAQYIYNDISVKSHFDVRVWVCVTDYFDEKRIIREIIESVTMGKIKSSGSLNALQVELEERLMRQKFLLVLDDVWLTANNKWEAFYAPFRSGHDGSMVLLTTRLPKVAQLVSTVKPIELEGLPRNIFWEFFKTCAFGLQHTESYPHLQDIGRSIADRLCGSPLAAKTLGRLLSRSLTMDHWRSIQSSELWRLEHQENEILPALQLSYVYLPQYLKRCFSSCSIFPKDYSFGREEIVAFWVAECFVKPDGTMRLEDVGYRYLGELRSSFLIQADPNNENGYVMHDLIHDMALSVLEDEYFLIQDLSYENLRNIPDKVRHMSVEADNEALNRLGEIQHLKKLHSLRFGTRLEVEVSWFKNLSNILFLSLRGCKLIKLPESICELNSLRSLDISDSSIQELPEKFWCLYNLHYFFATSELKAIHQDITKLVNLRHLSLVSYKRAIEFSKISGLGNLSSLQTLYFFTIGKKKGRKISELKDMNHLSRSLIIRYLADVQRWEEAGEARLIDRQYLKSLTLEWRRHVCVLRSGHNRVLEGLHPPSGIENLEIGKFGGDTFPPSWLRKQNLPALRTLTITECDGFETFDLQRIMPNIEVLTTSVDGPSGVSISVGSTEQVGISNINYNACRPFISLTTLFIFSCGMLESLDQLLCPEYLPSIQSIRLQFCESIESLPVHKFGGFVCLRDLKITDCTSLKCGVANFPPSLQRLYIDCSGELDRSLKPGCLDNLPCLTLLYLDNCRSVESILPNSINTNNLKGLVLKKCLKLSSIGGSHALSSIQYVDISDCPQLTEVRQPFLKKGLNRSEQKDLLALYKSLEVTPAVP